MDSTQKIEKNTHYNVILMGDDGRARTYRLRRGTVRFLVYFPFLMMLVAGGIIAGAVYFSKYYFDLVAEREEQDRQISEIRLKLQRLEPFEKLLSTAPGAAPLAKHEEIGLTPPKELAPPVSEQPPQAPEETAPEQVPDSAATGEFQDQGEAAGEEQAGESAETSEPQQNAAQVSLPLPELDFSTMGKLSGNKSPLRVAAFTARTLGQQRVRIRYELTSANKPGIKSISGLARHFAVFSDGSKTELPLPDNGETRFSITRMKPMEATARLPQGLDTKDIKNIDVVIVTDDYGTFHDLFDVTHWRSY